MGTGRQYDEKFKLEAVKLAREEEQRKQQKILIYPRTHWEAG